ncbi:MAG: rhomboid family intramembrane serine protease, partial [Oscillospiraceae bacterium]|nr:rhomboid family intramembrane serine protease [Oscillospiraceae bacterium]
MKMTATRITVIGISPALKLVKEVSSINAKTTPLAPQRATFLKKMKFTRPVASAAIASTMVMFLPPYFIGNMGYILLLGPMLEEKYGGRNIIIVIATAALATGLVNFIFFKNVALCGASGVVF